MSCNALVRCVLVLRCGMAGEVCIGLQAETLPTYIEPEQYNSCNNGSNKSQVPEDGCINIRNMLSMK